MKFTKMQGTGNDFVLVETGDSERDWSPLAIAMCDRHYGVGADGLLLLMPSAIADFKMRIFNADGSEAKTCGNGIRCLVKYFVDSGLAKRGAKQVSLETAAGVRQATFSKAGSKVKRVKVGMGVPLYSFSNKSIVIKKGPKSLVDIKSKITQPISINGMELTIDLVSMGNQHATYFIDEPVADFPLTQIGPKVEKNDMFPTAVNFEIARVVSPQKIEARVWEAGVGETLACGSGACAIAVSARLLGHINGNSSTVEIKLPGGTLEIEWAGQGEVFLSGPAETVFTGEWPE